MQVSRDLKLGENIVKNLAMDYITFTIADNIPGVGDMINNQPNQILRNLERGLLCYPSKEVENNIVQRTYNLRAINLKVAVDDTLFNPLAAVKVETIGGQINNSINSLVPNGIDAGRLTNAVILSGVRMAGANMGYTQSANPIGQFTAQFLGL